MGNKQGKEQAKKPEEGIPPIPEIQEAEEKAKKAAQDLKNSPEVKKLEEKARQTAETLKQSAVIQEGEKKLKEAAEAAKKAEEASKGLVDKAKQTAASIQSDLNVQKVEDKAKEVVEKAKTSVESTSSQDIQKTLNAYAKDISKGINDTKRLACAYYGFAKTHVQIINREAPISIAAFKRDYIFPFDPRVRAATHYGLTALTFLISLKARAGVLSTIRNTGFVGLTSAFFIYPESINPFRRQNFIEDREIEEDF